MAQEFFNPLAKISNEPIEDFNSIIKLLPK